MNQQQNQQESNSLQKKTEEALAASFVMPPIRTMADDLLEANKPVNIPISGATSSNTVSNAPLPKTVQKPVSSIPAPPVVSLPKPPIVRPAISIPTPPAQKPVLASNGAVGASPDVVVKKDKRSVFMSVSIGIAMAVIICVLGYAGYLFWPDKKTNTIADSIPEETIAFVSVKRGAEALEKNFLPKVLVGMGLSLDALGNNWNNVVYGIIPGSSPSEPIGYLMTDDAASVNVAGSQTLAVKKLSNGNALIVGSNNAGRIDGLSGRYLGGTGEFRNLVKKISLGAEYFFIKKGESASVFNLFSFLPINKDYSTLMVFSKSNQDDQHLALTGVADGGNKFEKKQISWNDQIKAVPVAVTALVGNDDIGGSVDNWRLLQSNNPEMQELLNSLNEQGEVVKSLKANLSGNYVAGSLFTGGLKTDGFAILPIRDEVADEVKLQMNSLESSLRFLGPLIGGVAYPEASFSDGTYKDVAIRFVNFGDSAHSFDYAVIDSVILVATSKTSMQQMIDAYKGDADNFVSALALRGTGQIGWQYVKFDDEILDKLSSAWKNIFTGFSSVYFEPVGQDVFTGNIAY